MREREWVGSGERRRRLSGCRIMEPCWPVSLGVVPSSVATERASLLPRAYRVVSLVHWALNAETGTGREKGGNSFNWCCC